MEQEIANAETSCGSTVLRGAVQQEQAEAHGIFNVICLKAGSIPGFSIIPRWRDTIQNTVMTEGKNLALNTFLGGSSYTVVGPYMGLISSVGWSATAAADVMTSHAGWAEAGVSSNYPLYNGSRKTCVWSAASAGSKALSSALSFLCETTGGTVRGCFIVFGTGAVNTKGDTNGTLWSAGVFSGGDKIVGVGDTIQITYSTSL
jgi:hypothetical protein